MSEQPSKQLSPISLQLAEYAKSHYVVTVDHAIDDKDICNPSFWAHVAQKLKQFDTVELRSEDGSFWAQYLVIAADRVWAKVLKLHYVDLDKVQADTKFDGDLIDQYEIKWAKNSKWSVIRREDRALMVEKLHSRTDAQEWLMKHLGAQKAA